MPRPARVDNPSVVLRHPIARYADRIRLHRYRRSPAHHTWEASYCVDGAWSAAASLKTEDRDEALHNAIEELTRREGGLTPRVRKQAARTFEAAAALATEMLKERKLTARKAGKASRVHGANQLLRHIRNLTAHFGAVPVTSIRYADVRLYLDKLRVAGGGTPAQSTIGNISHAWSHVMAAAVRHGWLDEAEKLTLSRRGFDHGEARVALSWDAMLALARYMSDEWIEATPQARYREIRRITRAYIAVGATTGIRPGSELSSIKVRHVRFAQHYVSILVPKPNAKTSKERGVACFQNDVFPIREMLSRLIADRAPDDLLFARADGTLPDLLHHVSNVFEDAGVKVDPASGRECTAYSLRHYYATQALMRGVNHHYLASEMGTSIAMIERHYDGVIAQIRHESLSGSANKMEALRATLRRDFSRDDDVPEVDIDGADGEPDE